MQADPLAARQRARLRESSRLVALQALLLATGPLLLVLGLSLDPADHLPPPLTLDLWVAAMMGAGALVSVGGWAIVRYPTAGRWAAASGLVAFTVVAGPGLVSDPTRALLVLLVLAGVLVRLRTSAGERGEAVPSDPDLVSHPRLFASAAEYTAIAAIVAWFATGPSGLSTTSLAHGAAWIVAGVALVYTAVWTQRSFARANPRDRGWFALLLPILAVVVVTAVRRPDAALGWMALQMVVVLGVLEGHRRTRPGVWTDILEHPARLLVVTFLVLVIVGGVLLTLPACSRRAGGLAAVDAFFVAVSGVCLTGLTVVDPLRDLTPLGQTILLVLVQAGGLAIMTFSTGGLFVLGRQLGLRAEVVSTGLLHNEGGRDLYGAARRIFQTTFIAEAIGAAVLALLFWLDGDNPPLAAWRGTFTAISAFCNAGFTLGGDSLVVYQGQPLVLHAVAVLALLGGLGTPVLHALPDLWRGKPVSMQTRLVLAATVVLVVGPAFFIAAVEWNWALSGLSPLDKIHNAWFMAVVPRTAGFRSLDLLRVRPATVTLLVLLMFIGGAPLSTAGGVKVTTVSLLVLAVVAALRGRTEATAFGRKISHESIYKAVAIMTLGSLVAFLGFIAVQLTQDVPFDAALFEVVSAVGNVGLSLGATPHLDAVGKIIVMTVMFVGRIGPLTLFLLLAERRRDPRWAYPEERVAVG